MQELTALWWVVVLQVRFDGLVLLVEEGEVGYKVLDDVHCGLSGFNIHGLHAEVLTVGERVNLGILAGVAVNSAEACKGILSVDVHSARTADALTARAAESQGGVKLVLDLDQGVENLSRSEGQLPNSTMS